MILKKCIVIYISPLTEYTQPLLGVRWSIRFALQCNGIEKKLEKEYA